MKMERVLLVLCMYAATGLALNCISCKWNAGNHSADHNCLGAPYKMSSVMCSNSTTGPRPTCQTHIAFKVESNVTNLESLERKCGGPKHNRCNNACTENSDCWTCCNEEDNCNSFPMRLRVLATSSGELRQPFFKILFVTLFLCITH